VDKEAADPDEDDAWCKAEEALMAALIAAPACTPEEFVLKTELVGCLIDRHAPRYAPSEGGWIEGTVLNDLVESLSRDGQALAVAMAKKEEKDR
jgi:hypothetical protein